jgi:membrane-associated phospholipid phosphatase
MEISESSDHGKGTPIQLPDTKQIWTYSLLIGSLFWIVALILWWQGGIDKAILFYFDPQRVSYTPIIALSKTLSSYGMAAITILFILYLLFSKFFKSLDAPLTVYIYTICSYGLSGIAGDLLKMVFDRPRPRITFGSELTLISSSVAPSIPSGHATKSIALLLPFLLLVGNDKNLHKVLKVIIALIGVGVCFSRIALGAHYLSDVLAGIGTALIGLPPTMLFANMVLRKATQEKLPALSIVWGMLLIFLTLVFLIL